MTEQRTKNRCVICGKETDLVYNINWKAVPICKQCALSITKQEVSSWVIKKRVEYEEIERLWKNTWEIIKSSKAYKEGKTLKESKEMLALLFERAMLDIVEVMRR